MNRRSLPHRVPAALNRLKALGREGDAAALYHTSVGLKARNQLVHSDLLTYPFLADRHLGETDPSDLFLGIDGLRDEYTWLGKGVSESPHYALVDAIDNGHDIASGVYLACVRRGTLDFRSPRAATPQLIGSLQDRFHQTTRLLDSGIKPVIKVVPLGGKLYIVDGKHRAALALRRGLSVECEDVTPFFYDSFFDWMRRKMKEQAADYCKQLAVLDAVETSRKEEGALNR